MLDLFMAYPEADRTGTIPMNMITVDLFNSNPITYFSETNIVQPTCEKHLNKLLVYFVLYF